MSSNNQNNIDKCIEKLDLNSDSSDLISENNSNKIINQNSELKSNNTSESIDTEIGMNQSSTKATATALISPLSSSAIHNNDNSNDINDNLFLCFDPQLLTYNQFIRIEHSYSSIKKAKTKLNKKLKQKQGDKAKPATESDKNKKKKLENNSNDTNKYSPSTIESIQHNEPKLSTIEDSKIVKIKTEDNYDNMNSESYENNQQQQQQQISASGRVQRTRKKPKRWDNDELEVDFSGGRLNLSTLSDDTKRIIKQRNDDEDQQPPSAKKIKSEPQSKTKLIIVENSGSKVGKKEEPIDDIVMKNGDDNDDEYDEELSADDDDDDDESIDEEEEEDDDEEENDDNSSNFDSDDDPEKLWCICRQPYDDRFMIGCDCCEEWFHGKCVNVTKVQGRKMEKLGEDWYCPSCREALNKGEPKELLKKRKIEENKERERMEAEKRAEQKATKQRKKIEKEKRKHQQQHRRSSSKHSNSSHHNSSNKSHNMPPPPSTTKTNKHELLLKKEEEEKQRLKRLIKASKKDLNEKREKLNKSSASTTSIKIESTTLSSADSVDSNNNNNNSSEHTDTLSHKHDSTMSKLSHINTNTNNSVVNNAHSPVTMVVAAAATAAKHKKHKNDPIDKSVQDLFKADATTTPTKLVRSLSSSSSSMSSSISPTSTLPSSTLISTSSMNQSSSMTASHSNVNNSSNSNNNQMSPTINQSRKSSIDSRRSSLSSNNSSILNDNDNNKSSIINCPNCHNQIIRNVNVHHTTGEQLKTIYCNHDCLQSYVTEMLKLIKKLNNHKDGKTKTVIRLIDRTNNQRIEFNVNDKDLYEFIRHNQTYEIYKANSLRLKFSSSSSLNINNNNANVIKNSHKSSIHIGGKPKPEPPTTPTKSNNNKSIRSMERTSSISSNHDDDNHNHSNQSNNRNNNNNNNENRRQYVRNMINDILKTRYKELSKEEKETIESYSEIVKLSKRIEQELFNIHHTVNSKYQTKSRSLIFNLKDSKNTLFRKVLLGTVTPERLVSMSPEELASAELSRWREHEKKTMIQLITRDAFEQANHQQNIVKKTHKGEECIQDNDVVGVSSTNLNILELQTNLLSSNDNEGDDQPSNSLNDTADTVANDSMTDDQHSSVNNSVNEDSIINDISLLDTSVSSSLSLDLNQSTAATSSSTTSVPISPIIRQKSETETPAVTTPTVVKSQPKRVRVENDSFNEFLKETDRKLTEKILQELNQHVPISDSDNNSNNNSNSNDGDHTDNSSSAKSLNENDSKSHLNDHQQTSSKHTMSTSQPPTNKPIWKGQIFMQDVAKFLATIQILTGNMSEVKHHLRHDYMEQITVCGRIAPEQALDYIEKLKISKHSEIILLKFLWTTREERTGYDAFFNYLVSRNRLGVVYLKQQQPSSSNGGQTNLALYKDFYIMPLASNNDVPEILMPHNNQQISSSNNNVNFLNEIGKKNHRPNLLLGILVKTRKSSSSSSSSSSTTSTMSSSTSSNNSSTNATNSNAHSNLLNQNSDSPSVNERSYTPPLTSSSYHDTDDGSYTPPPLPSSSSSSKYVPSKQSTIKNDLKSLHDEEKLNNMIDNVQTSKNPIEMTASILNAIVETNNLELQGKLLNKLHANIDNKLQNTMDTVSAATATASLSSMTQAQSHSNNQLLSNTNPINSSSTMTMNNLMTNIKNIQLPDNLKDILKNVQEKTAKVVDAEQFIKMSNNNNNSLYSNVQTQQNNVSFNDPRLRPQTSVGTNKNATLSAAVAASMTKDELLQKAQEQMAALAKMEYQQHQHQQPLHHPNSIINNESVVGDGSPYQHHHHHSQQQQHHPPHHHHNSNQPYASHHHHHHQQQQQQPQHQSTTVSSNRKISFQWKKKK